MSETYPISVACKLEVSNTLPKEIDETLLVFASACDWVNQNTPNKMTNKTAMQSLVYQNVRTNFGLSANLAIQAIRRVCANRKTAKQKGRKVKEFTPTSISYDARISGIRERTNKKPRSRKDKRLGNNWAFYQLRQFLAYKCVLAGIKLILVNPAWTSQTCYKCHVIGDRKGKKFACNNCGNKCDADYNGAQNIKALGAIINRPGGSGLSCKLNAEVQYIQRFTYLMV